MLVYDQVRKYIIESARPPSANRFQANDDKVIGTSLNALESGDGQRPKEDVATKLSLLQQAYLNQVLYIVGKEQMRISAKSSLWRRVTLHAFLWLRENTRSRMATMNIPFERLVEVGFVKEV